MAMKKIKRRLYFLLTIDDDANGVPGLFCTSTDERNWIRDRASTMT